MIGTNGQPVEALSREAIAVNICRKLALGMVQVGDEAGGETSRTLRTTADAALAAIEKTLAEGKINPDNAEALMTNIVQEALRRTGQIPSPSTPEKA